MTIDELKELFNGIYVLLGMSTILLVGILFFVMFMYIDFNKHFNDRERAEKAEKKYSERLEFDRMRYEHEQLYENYKKHYNNDKE